MSFIKTETYTAADEKPNCIYCDNCGKDCEFFCGPEHDWHQYGRTVFKYTTALEF